MLQAPQASHAPSAPVPPTAGRAVGRAAVAGKMSSPIWLGDSRCGVPDGVAREVGVAGGRLDLRVAEQPSRSPAGSRRAPARGSHKSAAGRGCVRRPSRHGRARGPTARRCWTSAAPPACRGSPTGCPARGGWRRGPPPLPARARPCAGRSCCRRGRSSRASRCTSSQRSVRISFRRQPVSMSRRSAAAAWGETRPVASSSSSAVPKRWNSASVRKRSRRPTLYFCAARQGLTPSAATPQAWAWSIMRDERRHHQVGHGRAVAERNAGGRRRRAARWRRPGACRGRGRYGARWRGGTGLRSTACSGPRRARAGSALAKALRGWGRRASEPVRSTKSSPALMRAMTRDRAPACLCPRR